MLSKEDVKKMLDTCRRRVGENETESDLDDDDDDDENDDDDDSKFNTGGSNRNDYNNRNDQDNNNSQKPYNFNGFNYQSDFQNDPFNLNNDPRMNTNYRTQNGRNGNMGSMGNMGNMGDMNSMGNAGNMGGMRNGMTNSYSTYGGGSSSSNNNSNNNNNWNTPNRFGNENSYHGNRFDRNDNTNNNQTKQDRECFLHCVFHEMKMVMNNRPNAFDSYSGSIKIVVDFSDQQ